jgi:hypothetical protein
MLMNGLILLSWAFLKLDPDPFSTDDAHLERVVKPRVVPVECPGTIRPPLGPENYLTSSAGPNCAATGKALRSLVTSNLGIHLGG